MLDLLPMPAPGRIRYQCFGAFRLDLRSREVRRNGIKVRIPDQSVQILSMLLEHPGELVTREEMHRKLWPNGTIVEFDHSINAAIKRLRQALEDSAESPRYIETLPRLGYRFIGSVEQEPADDAPAGAPESEPKGREGETVSHYRVQERIGGGGMGVVYKAEDTRLGRIVALKFLPDVFSDDQPALDRFQREGYAVSAINHPNICTLYDIGQVAGQPFLAMEFLAGRTLLQAIAEGPLTLDRFLDLAIQIAGALEAAHAKGVVHRDIKPSNIFVTDHGLAKVLDFGLAKMAPGHAGGQEPRSIPGAPMGTVAYMSPEQAAGLEIDARTDLFSLGVVLHEMANALTATPAELNAIIAKALERNREARYQTASSLRADLQRVKQERTSGKLTPESTPGRRHRLLIAAGIALALLAGVTVAWLRTRPSETSRAFSQRRLTANPDNLTVDQAAISLDGNYLGYSDHRGIYLQLLRTGEVQNMPFPHGFQPGRDTWSFVAWYPDSTRFLASLSAPEQGASLWSVPILGGAPLKLIEGTDSAAASPDGSRIAYLKVNDGDRHREIWLMGPQGESPHRILNAGPEAELAHLNWAPGGNRIAYQYYDQNRRSIDSCDVNGKARTTILSDPQVYTFHWILPRRLIFARYVDGSAVLATNLWELTVDGKDGAAQGKPRRLTDWSGFAVMGISATSDGKHLAFRRSTYHAPVFIAELAHNGELLPNPRRLTEDEYVNMAHCWTADSRELIFTSNRAGTTGLYKQALNGKSALIVSSSQGIDIGVARLSPDGSSIVFNGGPHKLPPETPSRIYRLGMDGGVAQPLLEAGGIENLDCANRAANFCVYSSRSADGRKMIFTAFDPLLGKGKELLGIAIEPGGDISWMISPDGSTLAVVKGHLHPNQLQFTSVSGGQTRTVEMTGHFQGAYSVGWAPDSRSVFVGGEGTNTVALLRVDLKGNAQNIFNESHGGDIGGMPSPDGRHLAITTGAFNTNVWLIDNF